MTNEQLDKELKKLKKKLCCIKSDPLYFDTFGDFPVVGKVDYLYIDKATNSIYLWDGVAYQSSGGGDNWGTQVVEHDQSLAGSGTSGDPLNVNLSTFPNQGIVRFGDGIYTPSQIRNGLVSGGIVTWLGTGFQYNVSPAVYYINGVLYNSPSTNITLDPSDVTNNRFDVFVLTTSSTADKVTGTPAVSPEKPATNSGTQLEISFVLVFANTTTPFPVQDYIYREGVEWIPSFNSANIVQTTNNPLNGVNTIEGTNVVSGNTVTFTRGSITTTSNFSALILNIRSKATWGSNRTLTLRFRNGVTNIANVVTITRNSPYGFNSSTTGAYQRVVIPILDFGLIASDIIDRLVITASGSGGTQGFFIDDIEFQGQASTSVITSTGTTDNVGVFYVSKNYTGIGAAMYDNGVSMSSVSSTNTGFMNQLQSARMGDPNKAYPDPYAAGRAANFAIANGIITRALVVVNGGNSWTYGSQTASNNGDTLGNSATPTVADIGLLTGNSLMRNNIDFYFHPNSTMINICRNQQLLLGLNTNTSNTAWKSGIYGYGTFIAIYGTNNGLSQRMFQIGNGNGEMTVEADTIIAQRAWLFVNGGESPALLKFKAKKVITDGTGSLLFYAPATPLATEATSQSSIILDVDAIYKGQKYFPYPSTPVVSGANWRGIFETSAASTNTSTRERVITANIKQCFVHDTSVWLISDGNTTALEKNLVLNVNIDRLKQECNVAKTGTLFRGGIHIALTPTTGIKINKHFNVNIGVAEVEEALTSCSNYSPLSASSTNNSLTVKIGSILKTGSATNLAANYIFGIPSTSAGSAGQAMRTIIECGYALSNVGPVFKSEEYPFQGNTFYKNNMIIKGTFKTSDGSPVISDTLTTSGNTGVILDNVTFITSGANSINSTTAGDIYYSKDSYSNVAVNLANVTVNGVYNVDTNLTNFL